MGQHINARARCQPDTPASQEQTTPPGAGASTTLAARYGAALLTGGHTALPTFVYVYYARLGVSEAELVFITQLCSYWWSARDPFPGEAALAARMGKTVRCIQGYSRSLVAKGLLHIHAQFSIQGRQQSNAYDLRPFFAAVEGLARLDGLLDDPTPAAAAAPRPPASPTTEACKGRPCDAHGPTRGSTEQDPLCVGGAGGGPDTRLRDTPPLATEEGEGLHGGRAKNPSPQVNPVEVETFDLDSIPPTPAETAQTTLADDRQAMSDGSPDDQALAQRIADLSSEFGDDAPASSLTRARSLGHTADVPPARLLQLLDEAAARTRARQAHIIKRRRDGQAVNGMPYFFAVLTDLLHPAPPRTRTTPDRRRAARHRQPESSPVSVDYVAWTGAVVAPAAGDLAAVAPAAGDLAAVAPAAGDLAAVAPAPEQNPTWRRALDELRGDMLRENYVRWFGPTRVISDDGTLLCIAVPDAFHQQWLDRRLRAVVERALARIAAGLRVEFVVEAAA